MNTIVTGAAGFIGSHLAEKLKALGHKVTGIDCFTDYYDVRLKRINENDLKNKGISILNLDLASNDLAKAIEKAEIIYHAAAQPGISAATPFEAYEKNNVTATFTDDDTAGLTVTGTDNTKVLKTGDTMTGTLTMNVGVNNSIDIDCPGNDVQIGNAANGMSTGVAVGSGANGNSSEVHKTMSTTQRQKNARIRRRRQRVSTTRRKGVLLLVVLCQSCTQAIVINQRPFCFY